MFVVRIISAALAIMMAMTSMLSGFGRVPEEVIPGLPRLINQAEISDSLDDPELNVLLESETELPTLITSNELPTLIKGQTEIPDPLENPVLAGLEKFVKTSL